MADNVTLVRSLYDGWNKRNFEMLADAMASDGKIIIVGSGETFEGREGSLAYSALWADGFPDAVVTIDNIVAEGDKVVVEFTGRGTHTGTLLTPMGPIPATGRSVTLNLCEVIELSDGKVKTQRSYLDSGSVMAQLGLAAEEAATTNQ